MAWNGNRGGNRGGFNGGQGYRQQSGGNRGGGQQRQGGGQGGGYQYLYSSAFVKNILPEGGQKERVYLEPGVTEEVTFTLTPEKAQEFIDRILASVNDPAGDGGVRVTLYCNQSQNQQTGEQFDSASIMVLGKFPPQNQNNGRRQYGNGQGGNAGRRNYNSGGQGGGRNSYSQQGQGLARPNQRSNNQQDQGYDNQQDFSQGNGYGQQGSARQDMNHSGGRGNMQDNGYQNSNNGHNAQNNASHFNNQGGYQPDASFGADDIPF